MFPKKFSMQTGRSIGFSSAGEIGEERRQPRVNRKVRHRSTFLSSRQSPLCILARFLGGFRSSKWEQKTFTHQPPLGRRKGEKNEKNEFFTFGDLRHGLYHHNLVGASCIR